MTETRYTYSVFGGTDKSLLLKHAGVFGAWNREAKALLDTYHVTVDGRAPDAMCMSLSRWLYEAINTPLELWDEVGDGSFHFPLWALCLNESKTPEEILDEVADLFLRKQDAYGPTNIDLVGVRGIHQYEAVKWRRLINIANGGDDTPDDSARDTLIDLIDYVVIRKIVAAGDWPGGTYVDIDSVLAAADWMNDGNWRRAI